MEKKKIKAFKKIQEWRILHIFFKRRRKIFKLLDIWQQVKFMN